MFLKILKKFIFPVYSYQGLAYIYPFIIIFFIFKTLKVSQVIGHIFYIIPAFDVRALLTRIVFSCVTRFDALVLTYMNSFYQLVFFYPIIPMTAIFWFANQPYG